MGYRGKVIEQGKARELRADAWSLLEIAEELGVSKSSVSLWVRNVDFEPRPRRKARKRGPNKLERAKQAEIERFKVEGLQEIGRLLLSMVSTLLRCRRGSVADEALPP